MLRAGLPAWALPLPDPLAATERLVGAAEAVETVEPCDGVAAAV